MDETAKSRWEDYMDVFTAPSALFERRTDGKFGQAMVVFVVLAAVLYYATLPAMQPIMEAEFMRGMPDAQTAQATPEQIETMRRMSGIFGGIGVIIFSPISFFVVGALVWLGAKVAGGSVFYGQGTTIATFAMFPRLLQSVVSAVQALFLDESQLTSMNSVSLGLGRLLDAESTNPVLLGLLSRVDVFTIWVTLLIALGLRLMARVPTGAAMAGAAVVWLIGAVPSIVQALMR